MVPTFPNALFRGFNLATGMHLLSTIHLMFMKTEYGWMGGNLNFIIYQNPYGHTVDALISGHPQDAKNSAQNWNWLLTRMVLIVATRGVGDRWPLTGACPANKKYSTGLEIQKNNSVLINIFLYYCALYCTTLWYNEDNWIVLQLEYWSTRTFPWWSFLKTTNYNYNQHQHNYSTLTSSTKSSDTV